MKTGNTLPCGMPIASGEGASMEPGHEDREYFADIRELIAKTAASMEPGHEDREYETVEMFMWSIRNASMEPGHEDREYLLFQF